jgi:hypothetical protein
MKRKGWSLCDTLNLKELRAKLLLWLENEHNRFLQNVYKDVPQKLMSHSRRQ